jgi:hypothetical protein
MQAEVSNYRENTGSTIGKLRELDIGLQYALDVNWTDAASARTLISIIHKEKEGKRLTTSKTATGIKVWRIK